MKYPRLYLAVDNCFASKRWTRPAQWMALVKELGVQYIEASADNECDPLYTTPAYLQDWAQAVKQEAGKQGMKIANLFSGHGTYSTLGLAHSDARVRQHLAEEWIKPFLHLAKELGSGMGFYCHAFNITDLQSSTVYNEKVGELYATLSELNAYNRQLGGGALALEQMYTPHQYPWTIGTTLELMRQTQLYTALDTGHQTGQARFVRPGEEQVARACLSKEYLWVGTDHAHELLYTAQKGGLQPGQAASQIARDMEKNPHLFAKPGDGDLYQWAASLGRHCPIVHLQQTNGVSSSHNAFSFTAHQHDKVWPAKLLQALKASYDQEDKGDIPCCSDMYLTLELFFPTNAYPAEIYAKMKESIAYWRAYIPEDGMRLNEAVDLLEREDARESSYHYNRLAGELHK